MSDLDKAGKTAEEILHEYTPPNSGIDSGNLFFAAHVLLDQRDALRSENEALKNRDREFEQRDHLLRGQVASLNEQLQEATRALEEICADPKDNDWEDEAMRMHRLAVTLLAKLKDPQHLR